VVLYWSAVEGDHLHKREGYFKKRIFRKSKEAILQKKAHSIIQM